MPITIVDIAKEVNLSHTTVSKILNRRNDHSIPAETKDRVRKAAASLGYRPNHMARSLRSGRSHLISLMVGRVRPAFFSRSIAALHSCLHESGYDLRIEETAKWSPQHWGKVATDRWQVDGAIVIESAENMPFLIEAAQGRFPAVHVGTETVAGMDHVYIDLYGATLSAVRHLVATGRRRIAYMATSYAHATETSRGLAYEHSMREAGLSPEIVLTDRSHGALERELAIHSLARRLGDPSKLDALLCFNDELAIGALRALKEQGLRVPQDVALIGCDDIDETEYHDPQISSLHYPYEEAARLTWEMLLRRVDAPYEPVQAVVIPSTLIVRKSSSV